MKSLPPLFVAVAFLATAFAACRGCEKKPSGTSIESKNQLLGRWEIREGFRDERPEAMFDGAWIEFSDSAMLSNLPLPDPNFVEVPIFYEVKKDILTQFPEGAAGVDLKILNLSDSSLTLDFVLRQTAFRLVFGRSNAAPSDSTAVDPVVGQ